MRGKSRKGIVLTSIIAGLLAGSSYTSNAQELANINTIPAESTISVVENPVLLKYKLTQEKNGEKKELGSIHIYENSIEAKLHNIFSILFSQPNDSTYQEKVGVKLFGNIIGETYDYSKDSIWKFDNYNAPFFFSKDSKKALVGSAFNNNTLTPIELFKQIIQGTLADSTETITMGWDYDLYSSNIENKKDFSVLEIKIGNVIKEKNDVFYMDDPIKSILDTTNVPYEAEMIFTLVEYNWGVRNEEKLIGRVKLDYINRDKLFEAYGNSSDQQ